MCKFHCNRILKQALMQVCGLRTCIKRNLFIHFCALKLTANSLQTPYYLPYIDVYGKFCGLLVTIYQGTAFAIYTHGQIAI